MTELEQYYCFILYKKTRPVGEEPPPRHCIKKGPYDPGRENAPNPGPCPQGPNRTWAGDHRNIQAGAAHRNLGRRCSSPSQRAQRGGFFGCKYQGSNPGWWAQPTTATPVSFAQFACFTLSISNYLEYQSSAVYHPISCLLF